MRRSHLVALLTIGLLAGVSMSVTGAEHDGWTTSHAKAVAQAKKEKKPILALFTGSDWCPPCMALEKNIFSSDTFKKWAKENVVLLMLDYPRSKPQDSATKEQNKRLGGQYKISGYPTVIIMDAAGKEAERFVGFSTRATPDAAAWIKQAEPAVKKAKG